MSYRRIAALAACILLSPVAFTQADVNVIVNRNPVGSATPQFKFSSVVAPSQGDAASEAKFEILSGQPDRNGGVLGKLHDGLVPDDGDQPSENFFFRAGSRGGRILVDLTKPQTIRQVNTYSWHRDVRGPQVYGLYASLGSEDGLQLRPDPETDPSTCGWTKITSVDTRPKDSELGGQYGVSIHQGDGALGNYRYLLFDIARTESRTPFGQTFFSEIDIIAAGDSLTTAKPIPRVGQKVYATPDEKYHIVLDTSGASSLSQWAEEELMPVVLLWYPKIVDLLPSEGYEAPTNFRIRFSDQMQGVAATGGTTVSCAGNWFRRNLQGEAIGAVVHELVHVVQQYDRARRIPGAQRTPGWVVEGIADYVRWYLYEPQSNGAAISPRRATQVSYDNSYRVSANFLNWVSTEHCPKIVTHLNAAAREGSYSDQLWQQHTGHSLEELGAMWKKSLLGSEQ